MLRYYFLILEFKTAFLVIFNGFYDLSIVNLEFYTFLTVKEGDNFKQFI